MPNVPDLPMRQPREATFPLTCSFRPPKRTRDRTESNLTYYSSFPSPAHDRSYRMSPIHPALKIWGTAPGVSVAKRKKAKRQTPQSSFDLLDF